MGNDVTILEGLAAVRRRPKTYYGPDGLHLEDAAFHAMCLALTEAHHGTCSAISLKVATNSLAITDNGGGVSLEVTKHNVPFAQLAMTSIFALVNSEAGKLFVNGPNAVLGPALVTAVSKIASIETVTSGRRHVQGYTDGAIDGPFSSTPDSSPTGTTLAFLLDPSFVSAEPFSPQRFQTRINETRADLSNLQLDIRVD